MDVARTTSLPCKLLPSGKKPGGADGILHIKFQPFAPPPNSHCKHRKEPPQIDANLAFDCDRRSCIWPPDPPLPQHPPRSAPPPGSAAGRAWHASGRLGRRAPSAAAQERRQPRVTCAWPWQQRQRAPWQQRQQPAPPRPRRGCGGGVRPSRGARTAPPAPPRPSSGPALPSHLPRACPSGLCCWLLLLAAGCWLLAPTTSGRGDLWPSRTIIAVSRPPMALGWGRGHCLWARAWVHGHHPPHLPICSPRPQPSPHPRFGLAVTQPLSGSHPM